MLTACLFPCNGALLRIIVTLTGIVLLVFGSKKEAPQGYCQPYADNINDQHVIPPFFHLLCRFAYIKGRNEEGRRP
jgi:hypothetical protein